ncbi:MAG: hypothetical protein NTV01_12500 [Bacteroidia bacterium]|nr:hypothetical protein [Bacteroidia bacterium]
MRSAAASQYWGVQVLKKPISMVSSIILFGGLFRRIYQPKTDLVVYRLGGPGKMDCSPVKTFISRKVAAGARCINRNIKEP